MGKVKSKKLFTEIKQEGFKKKKRSIFLWNILSQ